jgi:hypothetical protein
MEYNINFNEKPVWIKANLVSIESYIIYVFIQINL